MRAIWDVLETVDRTVFAVLERKDRLLRRGSLLARAKQSTEHVKTPQRLITFDS